MMAKRFSCGWTPLHYPLFTAPARHGTPVENRV